MHDHPRRSGRLLVAAALIATVAMLGLPLPASAARPASASAPPVLAWKPCEGPGKTGFACAIARRVPLNYRHPRGRKIHLAVIRHRAIDPARRVGTLFFNPGGPGGAGTEDLPAWFDLFPAELRARFDIISWDPRGIGRSTAVQCFPTKDAKDKFFAGIPQGFPVGRSEERAWIRGYARFGRLCGRRNGRLLAHLSAAESAKDLDLLRRAVGAPRLNYIGVSYGTLLGATYANLFPNKVRALVLDGNVDPVAWTNGGNERTFLSTSLRMAGDKASARTLDAFLDLCGQAGSAGCAFSAGSPSETRAKWGILLRRLRKQPVPITYATLVSGMGGVLFTSLAEPGFPGWTNFATTLQSVWTASEPSGPPTEEAPPSQALNSGPGLGGPSSAAGADQTYAGPEQGLAVQCAESPNPGKPAVFRALGALSFARAGDIGPSWSWGDEPCATWPATAVDRYLGPWDRPTANPVLVIGNTLDPSTPYDGAVAMADELARARVLTVDGYGHTALLNPSTPRSCSRRGCGPLVVAGGVGLGGSFGAEAAVVEGVGGPVAG